ncbi:hypothetical protein [Cellulomonas septica]|uniref:Uncharacterized protein n=1 Tax=Cellulomonas septica TaxID=285080 RepID=A0ABX1K0B4_9CELL|nr:hypothetical protein [Cellulomonas septica]NKY40015.1 hypothetical protein [Cellulomonas septica]
MERAVTGSSDEPAGRVGCYCGCPTCPGTGSAPADASDAEWLHSVLPPATSQPWVLLPFGAVWSGRTAVDVTD